tara:strand:+ start:6742 stop:7203 length:462 start_codon:yes stop_codon:yes gene_type:complete
VGTPANRYLAYNAVGGVSVTGTLCTSITPTPTRSITPTPTTSYSPLPSPTRTPTVTRTPSITISRTPSRTASTAASLTELVLDTSNTDAAGACLASNQVSYWSNCSSFANGCFLYFNSSGTKHAPVSKFYSDGTSAGSYSSSSGVNLTQLCIM